MGLPTLPRAGGLARRPRLRSQLHPTVRRSSHSRRLPTCQPLLQRRRRLRCHRLGHRLGNVSRIRDRSGLLVHVPTRTRADRCLRGATEAHILCRPQNYSMGHRRGGVSLITTFGRSRSDTSTAMSLPSASSRGAPSNLSTSGGQKQEFNRPEPPRLPCACSKSASRRRFRRSAPRRGSDKFATLSAQSWSERDGRARAVGGLVYSGDVSSGRARTPI